MFNSVVAATSNINFTVVQLLVLDITFACIYFFCSNSRSDVLQLLEQPLVLPADELLVPEQHVPNGEEVLVFLAQVLVLAHVVLDEVDQRGRVQLVQTRLVDPPHGGRRGYKEERGHLTEGVSRPLAGRAAAVAAAAAAGGGGSATDRGRNTVLTGQGSVQRGTVSGGRGV